MVVAGLVLLGVGSAAAQDRPQPQVIAKFNGPWTLDAERSDPMPPVVQEAMQMMNAAGAGGAGTPPGGGRRGGGAMGNPYVQELMTSFRAPLNIELTIADASVKLAVTGTELVQEWTADGRKRPRTQVDGTILHSTARWRGERLNLSEGVGELTELRRELRLTDNGATLEVKLDITGLGPDRTERKLVYTRKE